MRDNNRPIFVTQPFLPPFEEYSEYLHRIWENKILTNMGPFHEEFENKLADYLGVKYISLFSNGTLALIIALKVLDIKGEVITTPYSFVATANAISWCGLKPVFADIQMHSLNIDPEKIEALITKETTAILPVHVYGNPCDLTGIENIAKKYGLKVIYDAAHAFGVKIDGKTILLSGDLSVLSFHATKVFQTFEGGAIISKDKAMKSRIDLLKNFGFASETSVTSLGINAKMNEIQAAMGLLQLKYFNNVVLKRQQLTLYYRNHLNKIRGIRIMHDFPGVIHCYNYFPIFVDEKEYGINRDDLFKKLVRNKIFGRRYFYPLISQYQIYSHLESATIGKMPVAEEITKKVICLPLHHELEISHLKRIIEIIVLK